MILNAFQSRSKLFPLCLAVVTGLLAVSGVSASQPNSENPDRTYNLDWKLRDGEVLAYKTAIDQSDSEPIKLDIDGLLNEEDKETAADKRISEIQLPEKLSMVSLLEKAPAGHIAIRVFADTVKPTKKASGDDMKAMLENMPGEAETSIQLRGSVNPDGDIASFYLNNIGKNNLALFFELPTHPVRIGDSWELEFTCLTTAVDFRAINFDRHHSVTLEDVIEDGRGRKIAVIDYMIIESLDGTIPSTFSEEPENASMRCSFIGRGYFLIKEGRWDYYHGELKKHINAYIQLDLTQRMALIPMDEVPKKYRDLE